MKSAASKTKPSKTVEAAPAPVPIATAPVDMGSGPSTSPAPAASSEHTASVEPTEPMSHEEAVRHKAYLRYLSRGAAAGNEVDDWLAAEAEHGSSR